MKGNRIETCAGTGTEVLKSHWGLLLTEGFLFVFLGIAAILVPQFFSVVTDIFLSLLNVVACIIKISKAWYFSKMPGFKA